jgi:Rad3-related DNA helicase
MIFPAPTDLGLPQRYNRWRDAQERAFGDVLSTSKPYVALVAPTGFGKSLLAEALALTWGGRSAYLVVSRALQGQLIDPVRGFEHRFDVRGKQNYDCRLLLEHDVDPATARCDQAEALCEGCQYKERGCGYYDALRSARARPHVLPNYAMWLAMARYSDDGLGEFSTLICDEAHSAPGQLCKALRIELTERAVEQFTRHALPAAQSLDAWTRWAAAHAHVLSPKLDALTQQARSTGRAGRELRDLKSLVAGLTDLANAQGEWVEDRSELQYKGRIGFEPLWPAPYANLLLRGIKRCVFMSATLRPKHLEMLGIDPAQTEFLEFPSPFPVARRPIIHVKTVQQRADMSMGQQLEAVRRVDQLLGARMDRKWLIDTVSFERSKFIRAHSQHALYMIANGPGRDDLSAEEAMRQFKLADAPMGLIGPSFRTGYDLPGTECEVAILYKVPFLDSRNPLNAARRQSDPQWEKLAVLIEIIQFFGRPMRSADDQCEGLILDDQFGGWFYWDCLKRGFVPQWWAGAVRLNQAVPRALPKLAPLHN